MKSIKQYITEEYNKLRLSEVVVKFSTDPEDIVVEVPDTFLEDQVNIYLDDTIINKTFVGDDYSNELFGKNADSIADVYFEYTGLNQTSLNADIEWDNTYDIQNTKDAELKKIKLSDFKFVITFDRFDVLGDDVDDDESIKNILIDIFNRCVSDEYEWPVNFVLDTDDIEFKR